MLASLTVDLTLALAKFESDSGKAAQIVVRDQDKMTRAARTLELQIERMAATAGKSNVELLTIKAAAAGVGDATIRLAQNVGTASGAFAAVSAAGAQAFAGVSASADAVGAKVGALLSTMVEKTRELRTQAEAARQAAVQQNGAGTLTDDALKARLAAIAATTRAEQARLQVEYDANKAALFVAAQEAAESDKRVAAAQKVIDVQNGLTATYRTQLQALRELRDTGALSPAQFKQAGADLLAQQPIAQEAAAQAASARAFVASLDAETSAIGKTRTELLALRAAQLGVTDQAAPFIARLAAAEKTVGGFAKTAKLTAFESQQLGFQIHDFVVQVVSGQSPITAFVQQGSQLSGTFGGAGNAVKVLTSFITPMRVALTAGAAAALGLAYAFHEGSAESKAFKDSLVLTGNFAGVTDSTFNALAKSIAASGQISISSAREFTQAMISTGQIGPQNLAVASEAAARYAQATGKSVKDVAAEFASLNSDAYASATKLNQSLNFLTATQLQHIRTLQETGRETEAAGLIYEALNDRLKKLEPNLGTLDQILRGVTNTWHRFWDSAFDVGRPETIDDKIARLKAQVAGAVAPQTSASLFEAGETPGLALLDRAQTANDKRRAQEELDGALREKQQQNQAAFLASSSASLDKLAQKASDYSQSMLKSAKAASGLSRDLAEANANFGIEDRKRAADPDFVVTNAKDRALILKKIRENYTDKAGVTEADAQRKAQLDQDLKYLKDNLQQEQDALKFNDQFLKATYESSSISLRDYYDEKRRLTAAGVQNELNTLTDEQARLEVELEKGAFKDPHEKIQVQTQLNESIAKYAKVQREASRAVVLTDLEEAAAKRALTEQVIEYRAQLLQLQGDEAGAAALRAKQAIDNAKLFATRAGGLISDADIANQAKALQVANALAEAQRKVGIATADAARAEEAYALIAVNTGASLYERDTAVYAIRVKLVEQLKDTAEKTKALADAERAAAALAGRVADPKVLAAAGDAALQYAKALDTIDPALNRLRDSAKSTADGITADIASAINDFKGFPALIDSISKTLVQAGTKFFVADPLKVGLENLFKEATEGDNPIGNFLKSVAGVKGGGPGDAQTAALKDSTTALQGLTAAVSDTAAALSARVTAPLSSLLGKGNAGGDNAPIDGLGGLTAKDLGGYFDPVKAEASKAAKDFGKSSDDLVASTLKASSSMGGLPGVVSRLASSLYELLFSTQASSGSGGSGGLGGLFSGFAGLFGSSGTGAASSTFASDEALALFFHSGGVVGAGGRAGMVPASAFSGAVRYHSGGIAGLAPDEIPAILRRREEVLRRDDPRHRDNGGLVRDRVQPLVVQVAMPEQNPSRETALQFGKRVGQGIATAQRRLG